MFVGVYLICFCAYKIVSIFTFFYFCADFDDFTMEADINELQKFQKSQSRPT